MSDTDPLLIGPAAQRELFTRFVKEAHGFSTGDVIGAACNALINALRQSYPTKQQAEVAFDELFGSIKTILMSHYDSLGRKRGVFPYDQVITMPFLKKEVK